MGNKVYIDLLVDFAFKKIFGTDSNKALLIDLLNSVFEGRKVIVDLIYNKNEHHGDNREQGTAIFDLLCTGDKGEKFLIEVQHSRLINFVKRSIFYTSRLISEQAPKGRMKEWQYNISEVYFVAVIDQNEAEHTEHKLVSNGRYLHDVCLCYRETGEIFYDHLGYTYIDLFNFAKTLEQCMTNLDRWLYHLKHMQRMTSLPNGLKTTIFEQLYSAARYVNLTKEEKSMYDQDLKRKWDNAAALAWAQEHGLESGMRRGLERGLEQGLKQGLEQGLEQGKLEEKLAIARNLKSMNMDPEGIAKATGLHLEEVEKL